MAKPFRLALLYLVPEGVNTWVAGVGSVINGNMAALPEVVTELKKQGVELSVYFATPAATPEVRGWNTGQIEKAQRVADLTGGEVVFLPNYTDGSDNFGALDQWKVISAAGTELAYRIAKTHDKTVVLAHSSHPFALAPVYIDMQADVLGVDVVSIYTIHSTAIQDRTFQFKGAKYPDNQRIMVEALAVQWAKFTDRIKLGCISHYMGRHLVAEHGAHEDCLVPTLNGIDTSDPHFALIPEDRKLAVLKENGVPLDEPLFFSWGRFVPEKGFDIFLEAASKAGCVHPVLVGMMDHSPEYPQKLMKLADELPGERTVIVKRDWDLVASILQWKNTVLVGVVSRYDEPHGLVVNETRLHAREGGPVVMVSNRGGLPEQVTDGVDGLIVDIDDVDSVAAKIRDFMALPAEVRDEMRCNALRTIEERYSFKRNIIQTLAAVCDRVREI